MMNDNVLDLLKKRYFKDGEESWEDLCRRVSFSIASESENPEEAEQRFFEAMVNKDFIPSSPCLMNADSDHRGQLSSCFVIALEDNLESIYQAKATAAKIFQSNGGVGFNISTLRPKDSAVETHGGKSCGVIGFMEEFELTASVITKNNARKGAIKVDLNVWHPDIYEFISCKDDTDKFTHMNISVGITDDFMRAVQCDGSWDLKFPDYSSHKKEYEKDWDGDLEGWEQNHNGACKVYKTVRARDLYRTIVEHAWKTGEPGVSFLDIMELENKNPVAGKILATNPCSEFCNIPYASCNLGSVNLSNMVENGKFRFSKLYETVKTGVEFLDNMISLNNLPTPEIQEVTESIRPIGLGVMGYADALYKLGYKYGSKEALNFTDLLMKAIQSAAKDTSIQLGEERDSYPYYDVSDWALSPDAPKELRNGNLLSIAPTGSISFIANTSGGIEPNFALVYERRTNEGDIYNIVNPVFEEKLKELGIYSEDLLQQIKDNNGSCQGLNEIPENLQRVFVTAMDVTPEEHIKVTSKVQFYVDLSVSKTINLPNSISVEETEDIYMKAWESNLKGITLYRDGSRAQQTLSTNNRLPEAEHNYDSISPTTRKDLGDRLEGATYVKETACGKSYITINHDDHGDILEVFVDGAKSGGCTSNTEALGRLASSALRGGLSVDSIVDSIKGLRCAACQQVRGSKKKHIDGLSCADVIAKVIEQEYRIQSESSDSVTKNRGYYEDVESDNICPDCGKELRHEGGCVVCSCGYSKCN